jgi:hypothetical protein
MDMDAFEILWIEAVLQYESICEFYDSAMDVCELNFHGKFRKGGSL